MFNAYKTEQEIKNNLTDFILDWKKIREVEVREALHKLWTSPTPSQGSLLSDLLIENNFSYIISDPAATLESIEPEFFKGLLAQLNFRDSVLQINKLPRLSSGEAYFRGNPKLQKEFLSILQSNKITSSTPLFQHQEKALRSAIAGKDFILSSGTGSGKTEAFLFPALAKVFNETDEERKKPGIRVLIVYPMNALINSQISRLQSLIGVQNPSREPIRFALYNSKLKESQSRFSAYTNEKDDYCHWPDLQTMNREELRENPPHILVTNYSMLEYALIRPKDLVLFHPERQKLHTIILDEAHTYVGAMAAEIAMLLRRVLTALQKKSSEIQFFATSATLGDPQKDEGFLLRKFASELFSKDIDSVEYIDGKRITPLSFVTSERPIPINQLLDLLLQINESGPRASEQQQLDLIIRAIPSIKATSIAAALYQLFTRNEQIVKLVNDLTKAPFTVSYLAKKLGVPNQRNLAYLVVTYLSQMASDDQTKPLVKLRLHSVVEAPSGVFYCPSCKTYYGSNHEHCPNPSCNKESLMELAVCKKCGEPYLCATKTESGTLQPINWRAKTNSLHIKFTTLAGKSVEPNKCLNCGNLSNPDQSEESEEENTPEFDEYVIDPEIALYKQVFFSPISVSIDLIQKIAIDTLYENLEPHAQSTQTWLPGEGRRLLTFTDNRQGAAKLPTALDWLHEVYLGNRLIQESIEISLQQKKHLLSTNRFSTFSETGKFWLSIFDKHKPALESLFGSIEEMTYQFVSETLNTYLKQQPDTFQFFPNYGIDQLVSDILTCRKSVEYISFLEAQEALSKHPDLKELVGIFDKIEQTDAWQEPTFCSRIANWILTRSLGILSTSQYLPENSGLFQLSFPIPSSFLLRLQQEKVFKPYPLPKLESLILALLNYMRGNGSIYVDRAIQNINGKDLTDASKYCLQNALINKYMVLERSMIPEDSSYIKSWYNLKTVTETAPIQIVRKALDDNSLEIAICQNFIATAWDLMKSDLRGLFIQHEREIEAFALNLEATRLTSFPALYQCTTCARKSPHHINGFCLTPSCPGIVEVLHKEKVQNLYGYKRSLSFPKFGMRTVEHTAQLDLSELTNNERQFIEGTINVLSSSTTMELGIDIGGITTILLANCPPGPSNYLQRAGRAGRRSDRVAYVLTSARKVPLDHYFFLHPDLFFTRKPHDPYVSLNSDKIVTRHLNAYILREFFTHLNLSVEVLPFQKSRNNPLAAYGTVKDFFGFEPHPALAGSIIEHLLHWLKDNPELPELESLLENTNLALGFNKQSFLQDIYEFFHEKMDMLNSYIKELDDEIQKESSHQKRQRVLLYYKQALLNTDIVTFLINLSLLPKYGFPVNVVSLNTQNRQSKIQNDNGIHSGNRFKLERSNEIGIKEYAPGSQLIAGKRLLTSKGISLDSRFGGESFSSAKANLDRRGFIICNSCGHFYIVPPTVQNMPCPVCNTPAFRKPSIQDDISLDTKLNNIRYGIIPKGFRVDYLEDQPYAPNKIDKDFTYSTMHADLKTDNEAFIQVIPDILSIASTQSATFYAINQGPNKHGYVICLSCGRSFPENGYKPELMKNHTRLYSDKPCNNQDPLHYQSLIAEFITDAIQIRFKSKSFSMQQNLQGGRIFISTFARCLQLTAAKYLGIDDRELKFLVQNYWDSETNTWDNLEIVLYDDVPGGAGYSDMVMHLFGNPSFYEILLNSTECPEQCSTACPACLIAYEKENVEDNPYNRHLVRQFLEQEDIKVFFNSYVGKITPSAGDHTCYDIVKDLNSLLRGKASGKVALYFNSLSEDEFGIVDNKFGILLELAKAGIEVTLVFPSSLKLKSYPQLQTNLRYGLNYAQDKLHLRIYDFRVANSVAAVVDTGSQVFVYENYQGKDSSAALTPFSAFPCIRKQAPTDYRFPSYQLILKLDENPTGMKSLKIEYQQITSTEQIHLWRYLCDKFDLDETKEIEEVWYSDRYLLLQAENVCFLMLINDMPLRQKASINLAVNGDRSSYSDLAFQEREIQLRFLHTQMKLTNSKEIEFRMYATNEKTQKSDPGQAHARELFISYADGTKIRFTLDSGMGFFSPFIDYNWKWEEVSYKQMTYSMERNLKKYSRFMDSLIFKYPENEAGVSLNELFNQAIAAKRLSRLKL
jgi:hypothetical protein